MKSILEGRWVIDSNLLIYGLDKNSSFYNETYELFKMVREGQIQPVIAQQNIIEVIQAFVKGYKYPVASIIRPLSGLITELGITIITPFSITYQRFLNLIIINSHARDIFDYYLAATMLDNGINRILTVNTKDFSKIPGITAVNPFSKK